MVEVHVKVNINMHGFKNILICLLSALLFFGIAAGIASAFGNEATLISQIPDIDSTNLIGTDLVIKYNLSSNYSDINPSTVRLFFNTTSNGGNISTAYINGSFVNVGGETLGFNYSSNDSSANYTFNIPADLVYPLIGNIIDANSSYSCSASCHIGADYGTKINSTIGDVIVADGIKINPAKTQNIFKTRFYNISNLSNYNYFEAMVNVTTTTGQTPANVFFCNSSYVSGSVSSSKNCGQIGSFKPKTTFDHIHSISPTGTLAHSVVPFSVNLTTSTIAGVKIDPLDNFFAIQFYTTGWNIYYSNNVTRGDQTKKSTNGGTSWSNFSGTLRSHFHQFTNTTNFNYKACYNSTSTGIQYCSNISSDTIGLSDIAPTGAIFINPTETNDTFLNNTNITISWNPGYSLTDGVITWYNVTLWQSGTLIRNIGNFSNTTFSTSWNPGEVGAGEYNFRMNTTSNKSLTTMTSGEPFIIYDVFTPPTPSGLTSAQGNFWVNYTWTAGADNVTDNYNVSVNGGWNNVSAANYSNTTVGPHNWSNITVFSYNNTGTGTLNSTPASNNTQVANNVPVQSSVGAQTGYVGSLLTFTVSATDADSDSITYTTNATNGTFTSGVFTWTPNTTDVGTHIWTFNSSDGNGGVASETITMTVYGPIAISVTPEDNNISRTNFVNITVSLDRAGNATLAWDGGADESMGDSGTSFYKNKTNLLSGNYTFRIFVNDSYGSTNSTGTRTVFVNLTNTTNLTSYINQSTGNLSEDVIIISPSENVTVTIFNGTNATVNGTRIINITINSPRTIPYALTDSNDRFIGENLTLGPDGAFFNPAIRLNFSYNDSQLGTIPASRLKIKIYNNATGGWDELTTTIDQIGRIASTTTTHFGTFALTGTPEPGSTPPSNGGSGDGVGGGGVVTAEPYDNIARSEIYEKNLISNKPVLYTFKLSEHGIYEIVVTGKESENNMALKVEALKGQTKIAGISVPPGMVYKNLNVWAGSKMIKEGLIRFKVENTWIANNKIASSDLLIVRWNGKEWAKLVTSELKLKKDDTYTFYEAKTVGFSSFAITVFKDGVVQTATPAAGVTEIAGTAVKPAATETATPVPTKKTPGFEAIVAVFAIAMLATLCLILPSHKPWLKRDGKDGK